jgi:hypothetical protein
MMKENRKDDQCVLKEEVGKLFLLCRYPYTSERSQSFSRSRSKPPTVHTCVQHQGAGLIQVDRRPPCVCSHFFPSLSGAAAGYDVKRYLN